MKLRISSLLSLCLVAAAIPAVAGKTVYSNGPANGTVDAWTINFGYVVSDTFVVSAGDPTITGFDFYAWLIPGDTITSVDWSITSAEFGGTTFGSGTAGLSGSQCSTNQFGYNVCQETATGLNVPISSGTYWFNLQNAVVPSGDPVYWDENSGPSMASESAVGTIASEAFDITGESSTSSSSSTGTTPEPSSILLFGSGVAGLAGLLRRKFNL